MISYFHKNRKFVTDIYTIFIYLYKLGVSLNPECRVLLLRLYFSSLCLYHIS